MKSNPYITQWINRIINILFTIAVIGVIYVLVQLFLIASFTIPSNSMEPELMKGDRIWVWKPAIGARLFNIFASIKGKEVNIHRAPGMERIHRNDILVFNYPYARWNKWDKIELYVLKYYIKRCIALPGDTLSIHNGIYQIGKSDLIVGNMESQKSIRTFDPEKLSPQQFYTLPFDTILQWNIRDFGPLYIPQKGDSLPMNRTNYLLYKRLIEWELKDVLIYKNERIFLNDIPLEGYRFQKTTIL